jgi:O-methyltransferase involved in polyketide biosynthesis
MLRDYSTISPSARALLLMKGITDIPYAREAAELMMRPEPYEPDYDNKDARLWARIMHFEARYFSINEMLEEIDIHNVLELSSGFSFRGLEMTTVKNHLHYIDTDLPNIIDAKKEIIEDLVDDVRKHSKLELLHLNVLDEHRFSKIVKHFEKGPIAIVNEGLLMYLETAEKEELCKIIHHILKKYGGYWITGDIYFKKDLTKTLKRKDELGEFLQTHRIDEKKFDDEQSARDFFDRMGFVIDKVNNIDYREMSSYPYFVENLTPAQVEEFKKIGKVRETWRLKIK